MSTTKNTFKAIALPTLLPIALAAAALPAQAADWSDTSIGIRSGTQFAEPFNPDDIKKNIIDFNHVSGYKYGTNFFNIDLLLSDNKDPAGAGSSNGATEVYIVYRNTVNFEKVSGSAIKFGPVRGAGLTFGFDANTKTDAGYNSKKRMLVAGPTLMFDVPGFLDVSVLALWESNAPYSTFTKVSTPRYSYDVHPMLTAAWGIPIGSSGFSFEGFANLIASKGKDEFGNDTATETNIDMQIMYDLSGLINAQPKSFKLGFEYQYWKNKFGNNSDGPAGSGAFAKTPMIRAEYHF
ncbi:outer envelope protein [Roseateles koreensis]|uniref:Outer envelope protein n=1 Tax=Roseateles koreensis TaxID=2987526 RepID=A0ABT5KS19_9BURK|nr:outer envelope protein [Roseateles koreensis]MDC8785215.1 outer envelope protein [Roseateles koreensis]